MKSSSAIQIRPPSAASSTTRPPTSSISSSSSSVDPQQSICKNLQIYGTCRFKDTTCPHLHPQQPESISTPTSPSRLNAASIPFTVPSSSTLALKAAAAGAAVFVPGGSGTTTPISGGGLGGASVQEFVPSFASFKPSGFDSPRRAGTPALSEDMAFFSPPQPASSATTQIGQKSAMNSEYDAASSSVGDQQQHLSEYYQGMDLNGYQQHQQDHHAQALYEFNQHQHGGAGGGSDYYSQHQQPHQQNGSMPFSRQPLQYHLYTPSPSVSSPSPHSFFLPPSLHKTLTQKSEAIHAAPLIDMNLPEEVGGYWGLLPLDKGESSGGVMGFRTWCFKAKKRECGKVVVLRRVEGFRLQHEAAIGVVDKWTRLRHPNLVEVKEAFTTRAFGDHSLIFVYDFHPTSQTLYEVHLSPTSSASTAPSNPWSLPTQSHHHPSNPRHRSHPPLPEQQPGVPERVLWSYIVQISSALKTIHNAGLAVRGLESNRVLLTGKNRIRITGCGVVDVVGWDVGGVGGGGVGGWQQDDLLSFGKLLLSLACGSSSATATHNLPKSVDYIARTYSPDLKNLVLYLLSKPGPRKNVEEVLAQLGGRVVEELSASFVAEDTLEAELMRELENGRLVRLLTKFGFINERPEFDHDPRWAETGDRYIIKLFRDYVFHQVDVNGKPVTDLTHVISSLNKLDAGVDEKIMLISRDEQSCLIVSYREIKNCIETAFLDLTR